MNTKGKAISWCLALGLAVAVGAVAGCSAPAAQPSQQQGAQTAQAQTAQEVLTSAQAAAGNVEYAANGAKIVTLADGTQVQRTPDDENSAYYSNPEGAPSYNIEYLDADNRGCNACHDDLAELLTTMQYDHLDVRGTEFMQLTVEGCIACHEDMYYMTTMNTFGELVHGIHREVDDATCMTCHAATDTFEGDQFNMFEPTPGTFGLWDTLKYRLLHGISAADHIDGDFSFDQDFTSDKLFVAKWWGEASDFDRYGNEDNDVPRDESMLRDWEITFESTEGERKTVTMGELIDNLPSYTDTRTMQCGINVTNAGMLDNVKIEGVRLAEAIEYVGFDPASAQSLNIMDPAQAVNVGGEKHPFNYTDTDEAPDLLVYKINDELLTWGNGFPVVNWASGTSQAGKDVKQVFEVVMQADPIEEYADGSLPILGVYNLRDGQIVPLGDTLSIEGTADSFGNTIDAIQFSLDGENWTTYETAGTHAGNWVHWTFDWTPSDIGAYVLQVRAVNGGGGVQQFPAKYLINVK